MKEKMYIHSTDSSCEKTKQEKQKNFSILLLKKQKKNPEKTKTARWKKLPHSPLKWKKKEILVLTLCATNFYMPFVFFVMFYHTLLLPSTTLKTKTLVNCYVFLSFFFSSFRNFSYVLGKIAGKCWQWKETKKFSLS